MLAHLLITRCNGDKQQNDRRSIPGLCILGNRVLLLLMIVITFRQIVFWVYISIALDDYTETDSQTDRPTDRKTDRPTDRQTNRPTDWQTDRQKDKQTNIQICDLRFLILKKKKKSICKVRIGASRETSSCRKSFYILITLRWEFCTQVLLKFLLYSIVFDILFLSKIIKKTYKQTNKQTKNKTTKQNKTKNKTKQNKKQNKTKQNKKKTKTKQTNKQQQQHRLGI